MDLRLLGAPFPVGQLRWRVVNAGQEEDGTIWCRVIPYVDARVIMERFDEVCGIDGWQTRAEGSEHHLRVGIGVRTDRVELTAAGRLESEWIWKWDGTGRMIATDRRSAEDAGKGDHTNAFKRAAIQFGVTRDLLAVPALRAIVNSEGRYKGWVGEKPNHTEFRWDPPELPVALRPVRLPAIVEDMAVLLKRGGELGLGGGDEAEKALNGIRTVERALAAHDQKALLLARPWLEAEVDRLEEQSA